tara:strand:+ start:207 stop:755 length:549 start_codon:yes stop_codon:yes gene_type:complete
MARRVGTARVEALLEAQAREIAWGGSTSFKGHKDVVETLSAVGTVGSPTKTLTAADSGMTLFCDISSNSVVIQLPTPEAGLNYKIILSTASDGEGTYDLLIHTGSSSIDMGGNILIAGAIVEITSGTSAIHIDSSQGGGNLATVGDYLIFDCDGTDWYVQGSVRNTGAGAIADAFDGITPQA